jgi:hypothetical protein
VQNRYKALIQQVEQRVPISDQLVYQSRLAKARYFSGLCFCLENHLLVTNSLFNWTQNKMVHSWIPGSLHRGESQKTSSDTPPHEILLASKRLIELEHDFYTEHQSS